MDRHNATVGKGHKMYAVIVAFFFLTLSTTSTSSSSNSCYSTSEVVGLTPFLNNKSDNNCYKVNQSEDELNITEAIELNEHNRVKRGLAFYKTGKALASLASQALDNLLQSSGYDKRIRPQVCNVRSFCSSWLN